MEVDDKIAAFKSVGINESDDIIRHLLNRAGFDVGKAINDYFERSNVASVSCKTKNNINVVHAKVIEASASGSSKMKTTLLFLGRRCANGYTLNSGYLLGGQNLKFTLEGTNSTKGGTKISALQAARKGSDKFSAGKLIFETLDNYSEPSTKKVQGRLPNSLCDFIVPLLQRQLISLRGHVAFDIGTIGTFQDVPLSIQVFVSNEVFALSNENGQCGGRESNGMAMVDHFSQLLTWLAEGEAVLPQSKGPGSSSLPSCLPISRQAPTGSAKTAHQSPRPVTGAPRDGVVEGTAEEGLRRHQGHVENDVDVAYLGGGDGDENIDIDAIIGDCSDLNGHDNCYASSPLPLPLPLPLPQLISGVTLRAYQMQALQWMLERESKGQVDVVDSAAAVKASLPSSDPFEVQSTGPYMLGGLEGGEVHMHRVSCESNTTVTGSGHGSAALMLAAAIASPSKGLLPMPTPTPAPVPSSDSPIAFSIAANGNYQSTWRTLHNEPPAARAPQSISTDWLVLPRDGLVALSSSSIVPHGGSRGPVGNLMCENPLWEPIVAVAVKNMPKDGPCEAGRTHPMLQYPNAAVRVVEAAMHGVEGFTVYWWNRYSRRIRDHPPLPPKPCTGGLLADEMGMGKTVMMIALIASDYNAREVDCGGPIDVEENGSITMSSNDDCSVLPHFPVQDVGPISTPSLQMAPIVVNDDDDEDDDDEACGGSDEDFKPGKENRRAAKKAGESVLGTRKSRRVGSRIKDPVPNDVDLGVVKAMSAGVKCVGADTSSSTKRNEGSISSSSISSISSISSSSNRTADGRAQVERIASQRGCNGTLIVCPMSLMGQWVGELTSKINSSSLNVLMYHGGDRDSSCRALAAADVVVTSYGVLVSEAKKHNLLNDLGSFGEAESSQTGKGSQGGGIASFWGPIKKVGTSQPSSSSSSSSQTLRSIHDSRFGLFGILWHRVVLDEAHTIKNTTTEVSKACCLIRATRRWALTGTPIQNSLDDMYSLVKFLRHEPWDQARWWRKVITDPQTSGDPRAVGVLRGLLGEIMIRRTKSSKDGHGNCIVQLPKKTIYVELIDLEDNERDFYQALMDRSKAAFRGYESGGIAMRNKYAALFVLLMRMRQACDHPYLVMAKVLQANKEKEDKERLLRVHSVVRPGSSGGHVAKEANDEMLLTEAGDESSASGGGQVDVSGLFGEEFLQALLRKLQKSLGSNDKEANSKPTASSSSGSARKRPCLSTEGGNVGDDECDGGIDLEVVSSNIESNPNGDGALPSSSSYINEVIDNIETLRKWNKRKRRLDDASTLSNEPNDCPDGSGLDEHEQQGLECPVCLNEPTISEAAITSCGHIFCRLCLVDSIKRFSKCPWCGTNQVTTDVVSLAGMSTDRDAGSDNVKASELTDQDSLLSQSKLISSSTTTTTKAGAEWRQWGHDFRAATRSRKGSYNNLMQSSKLGALINRLFSVFQGHMARGYALDSKNDERTPLLHNIKSTLVKVFPDCDKNESPCATPTEEFRTRGEYKRLPPVKVVIFSQWTSMLDLVEDVIQSQRQSSQARQTTEGHYTDDVTTDGNDNERWWNYRRLDGTMTQAARGTAIADFNHDDDVRILLISLRAGGVGLNLVAASVVILIDPWWNPSTEDQAIDRVHRLGQHRDVHVYRLICRDTVEERLLALQNKKRALSHEVIGEQGTSTASKLTLEDLKAFFST